MASMRKTKSYAALSPIQTGVRGEIEAALQQRNGQNTPVVIYKTHPHRHPRHCEIRADTILNNKVTKQATRGTVKQKKDMACGLKPGHLPHESDDRPSDPINSPSAGVR